MTLPPGRFKLMTRLSSTGSPPIVNTIGMIFVAALAASAEVVEPAVASTATCRRSNSVAKSGS